MTDLTPNHPAVEAAHDASMAWLEDMHGDLPDDEMVCVLTAALSHLDADTEENLARLRDTPVGRALMAKAWDEGARATNRAWEHAYDGHPVDPDFPYYECQTCDVANPYPEEIE